MHFVVAGNGDGAFTDVCRIRIREFVDHAHLEKMVKDIGARPGQARRRKRDGNSSGRDLES